MLKIEPTERLRSQKRHRGTSRPEKKSKNSRKVRIETHFCFATKVILFTDDSFEKYNQFNPKLSDNLKTVKVNSDDGFREFSEKDSKRKLPKDRFGAEFPYTLNPVESVPRGKLSVMNVLDLLLDYRRNNKSTTEIASKYGISVEDAENIVKYVDIYQVITKTEQHDLYQLKTETTEKTEEIKSLPDFQKVIRDK